MLLSIVILWKEPIYIQRSSKSSHFWWLCIEKGLPGSCSQIISGNVWLEKCDKWNVQLLHHIKDSYKIKIFCWAQDSNFVWHEK